jgi:hypothetical protein
MTAMGNRLTDADRLSNLAQDRFGRASATAACIWAVAAGFNRREASVSG